MSAATAEDRQTFAPSERTSRRPLAQSMFEAEMAAKTPTFGRVLKRERGSAYRIDARPFGWINTFKGQPMSKRLATELLLSIRTEIARGKAPEDAVAPYLSARAKPNQVIVRYAAWLEFKQRQVDAGERSPRTVQEYRRYARPGGEIEWWEGRGIAEVDEVSLEEWSLWMARRGVGAKTRRNVLGAFRSFLGWLKKRKAIREVPDFEMPEVDEHAPRVITRAQQEAVLANIPAAERGPFLVACTMGLRPGEVRALTVGDVRLEAEPPMLVVSKAMKGGSPEAPIRSTKTRRARSVPISAPVLDWLGEHLPAEADADAPLFTNPRTGKRWSHWALWALWKKAAELAGVPGVKLYEGTKHSFATDALARTGDAWALQRVLGHSDERSSKRYALVGDAALVAVVGGRAFH